MTGVGLFASHSLPGDLDEQPLFVFSGEEGIVLEANLKRNCPEGPRD